MHYFLRTRRTNKYIDLKNLETKKNLKCPDDLKHYNT